MMFKMAYLLAKDDFGFYIAMPIGFAVFLLLIYGGFCLFIRWLRAWKPLPKGIRVMAWLFYACAVLVYIANFIMKEISFFLLFSPFMVLTPLCYITILVYRKNHTTSDDSQMHDTHLGPVFFIVLAIIVMTLTLLLLWIDKMNKQMSELNLLSIPLPEAPLNSSDDIVKARLAELERKVKAERLDDKIDARERLIELERLAQNGSAVAQCDLGNMYRNGEGVRQDYKKAFDWYSKSAAQGDAIAQNNLGVMYREGEGVSQDSKKAFEWYSKSAAQGYALAQHNLGVRYYKGEGVRQDYKKAFEWYSKAAAQGNAAAQTGLGILYESGAGVRQDYTKAFEWYSKSASQGLAEAQYNLGAMYDSGYGVRQDRRQAKEYYGRACDAGLQIGCDEFRRLNTGQR